ncbi:hypothetical protein MSAN_01799200 [Mycena sanguinolenta]|uniref:Uncharacterized protein n=1 Tax=Mycena sanguinolenta TaxID=230812 RepID=A0A8H7CSH5_9AGAR|nr:hypothetical protein MSAN_01799200 [Mycena sanguinolenta]
MKTESMAGSGHLDRISAAAQAFAETVANAQKAANADKIRADLALAESQRECADLKAKVKNLEAIIEQQRHDLEAADSRLTEVERERKDLELRHEKVAERADSLKAAEVALGVARTAFAEEKKKFEEKQRAARAAVDDIKKAAQTLESGYSSGGESAASLPNPKRRKVCASSDDDSDDPGTPNRRHPRSAFNPYGGNNPRGYNTYGRLLARKTDSKARKPADSISTFFGLAGNEEKTKHLRLSRFTHGRVSMKEMD